VWRCSSESAASNASALSPAAFPPGANSASLSLRANPIRRRHKTEYRLPFDKPSEKSHVQIKQAASIVRGIV
jgi:hypothetical protein